MSEGIQNQKLLYHLTSLSNLQSILAEGLKPRSELDRFDDVADQEIIEGRKLLQLENFVPFHWFARNPFDGRVQADRPMDTFVLISVRRHLAKIRNWKIIPRHPLSSSDISLLDYDQGIQEIDWETMNTRQYQDQYCKSVCMAECLSPATVAPSDFFKIFVSDSQVQKIVSQELLKFRLRMEASVNRHMFIP